MRRFGIICFLLSLCLVTQAQEETWQAWFQEVRNEYNYPTGKIMRIDGNGTILQQDKLPLIGDYAVSNGPVLVSPSGTYMVYVVETENRAELIVYDTRSEVREIRLRYPLPPLYAETIGFNEFESYYVQLFSEDETHLAFSYALAADAWEIIVIDLKTGHAVHSLRSGEGIAVDLPIFGREFPGSPVMPVIRDFRNGSVAFTLIEPGSLPLRVWSSYLWDIQASTVIPAPAYALLDMDIDPATGEIVHAYTDLSGEVPRLALYESGLDSQPQVIFKTDPDLRPSNPVFIQNGAAIIYETPVGEWEHVLNILWRGSSQSEVWKPWGVSRVYGIPTGFVYLGPGLKADETRTITFYEMNTMDGIGQSTPLFSLPITGPNEVIWFHDPRLTGLH